ncbi:MAG TPA: PilT/PilU family type 4a pilus ATPase [Bacteroidota bacterium]|nr:PilT/PilU family type 4a pilus ATPase [Bacteroidota bacterium]
MEPAVATQMPSPVDEIQSKAREILRQMLAQIPESVYGLERQIFIGDLVEKLPVENRTALRDFVNSILLRMFTINASDIDFGGFGGQGLVWYRIFGSKKPDQTIAKLEFDEINILIQSLLMARQRQVLYENKNLDFSYMIHDGENILRFRADAYLDLDQVALNMRAINQTIRPYKALELHPNITKIVSLAHTKEGLTLVTGITGSGKSSTLDAMIDLNNHTVDGHIAIIASPVEFVHKSDRCIVRHREVGRDVLSFKDGAIQALRQDPDIIVIGEMRDPETIMVSLEITDSGHKVFSTLHTASAVESIDRIIGEVPPAEQERVRNRLADVLRCVMSQKLIPSLDGKRVLAREVLVMSPSVRSAIKNNNTGEIYQMIQESGDQGMTTMEQDLKRLFVQKKISLESAINYSNNKKRMQQLLGAGTAPA